MIESLLPYGFGFARYISVAIASSKKTRKSQN